MSNTQNKPKNFGRTAPVNEKKIVSNLDASRVSVLSSLEALRISYVGSCRDWVKLDSGVE